PTDERALARDIKGAMFEVQLTGAQVVPLADSGVNTIGFVGRGGDLLLASHADGVARVYRRAASEPGLGACVASIDVGNGQFRYGASACGGGLLLAEPGPKDTVVYTLVAVREDGEKVELERVGVVTLPGSRYATASLRGETVAGRGYLRTLTTDPFWFRIPDWT
ncbi:MAG: hypothetical protein IT379_33395, partial [Deltaproteobacteria bacterium]|nr:hypothetical protein [Deltaproteobacteria bacterium]